MFSNLSKLLIVLLSITILFTNCTPNDDQRNWDPKDGYVPDRETALQVAEVILIRVYGKKVLEKKPFIATLKNGKIWVVEGSLPKGVDGGVPHIEIQKSDAKVVEMYHGK